MDKKRNSVNNTTLSISESLVSPRANSTKIANGTIGSSGRTGTKRKPTSPLSSRTAMSKTSLGTICYNRSLDPQTYTDITSPGLTSRLVRYGGNVSDDTRPQQSPLRTAFIKTSPFPVVKFKKQINKPSPQRSISLSNVRIAPPEKIKFQPNSRSNILRSGSMVAMHNIGNQNRNDNEPLNPTSSEPDSIPTRSVLDALKEISRKRINNEELDAERIKKQCKDTSEVDSPPFQNTLSDFTGNMSDLVYRSPMIQKRPRETQQISPQSSELEKQKKRLCTKNNEVFSSLSSSMSLITPKRQASDLNTRKGLDLNKEAPEETPVAPIVVPQRSGVIKEVSQPSLVVQVPIRKDIVPIKLPPVAPKLTLFNKKYEEKKSVSEEEKNNVTQSRFVKPKEVDEELESQIKTSKKIDQSKLTLLLQCLADELDEESEDMVDTAKKEEKAEEPVTEPPKPLEIPQTAPVIEIPLQPITVPIEQSEKKDEPVQKPEKPAVSFNLPQSSGSEIVTPTPIKPLFSFGVSTTVPSSATTTSSEALVTTVSSNVTVIASTPSTVITSAAKSGATPNVSLLFGNISNTEALPKPLISAPTSAFAPLASKPSFTFGSNNSSVAQTTTVASTVTTSVSSLSNKNETPTINFGGSNAGNTPTAIPTFGSIGAVSSSGAVSTTPVSISSAPAFTTSSAPSNIFGGFDPKNSIMTPNQTSIAASAFNVPSFSTTASPQTNVKTSLFTTPSTTTTSSNIFGASTTSTFTSPASNAFTFGQNVTKTETSTTQSNTFGNVGTATASSTFNFGSNSSSFAQPSIFGQSSATSSSNTGTANQSSGFSFKSPATQASTGGFSFNATAGTTESSKASVFSRLGPGATTTTSVVSPSKSLFTFTNPTTTGNQGQTAVATTASSFGANMTNVSNISQTSSIFGGNTTLNSTQNTTVFGNPSNTTTGNSNNLFGGNQTQPTKAPVSGLDTIFSSPTSNAPQFPSNPSTFGSGFGQKDSFTFGSNNNNNNNNAPFAFGQSSSQTASASSQENKPFTFGAASASNLATPPPAYGSQTQEAPKFNFSANAPTSPFGGNNNNNTVTPTFGSTPSPAAFNFTGNNNNVFGSGSSAGSTASSGAFNFTANQGIAPVQGGLSFNIGTGGGPQNQGRRPIRTATRRLNK